MRYTLIILLFLSGTAMAQLQKLSSFPLVSPGSSTWIVALQPGCGGYCNVNVPYTAFSGTGTVTSITAAAPLTGGTITSSGSIGLGTTGTAGTYGSATQVPVYTTDAYGRITATTVTAITYPTYNSGYGISITGTAPTFTVSATPYTAGRGMGINGFSFYSDSTVCLYADDSNVNKGYCSYYYARNNFLTAISLTAGSGVTITGVSPTYTISATPTTYYAGSNISVSSYSVAVVSNPTFTGLLTGTGGITTPTMTVTGHENIGNPTATSGIFYRSVQFP